MAKLKVYNLMIVHYGIETNGKQGQAIVATTSAAKAAELMGTTPHHMREYGSIGSNEFEEALALASPGVVLVCERPYGGAEAERTFITLAELDERAEIKRGEKTVDKPKTLP